MAFQDTAAHLDVPTVERLRTALELGKWPNDQPLSSEQKQTIMETLLTWEHAHLPPEQRTGYMPRPDCGPTSTDDRSQRIPTVDSDER